MSRKPWFWLDRQGEDYCVRVKGAALRLYPEWEQSRMAQVEEIADQFAAGLEDCRTEIMNLGSGPQPQAAYDGRPAWEGYCTCDGGKYPEGMRLYCPVHGDQGKPDRPATARVWPPSGAYCTCYEDPRTCWQHGEQDYR